MSKLISGISAMMIAAVMFIQFRDPATDQLMWVMKEEEDPDAPGQIRLVYDLDEQGKKKPIGVRAYSPGSKIYRNAAAINATANIARGKKGLNGAVLFENQTDLLARTVFEYVNFDYNGEKASLETNRAMFADEAWEAVREQVSNDQADLGKSLKNTAPA